MRSVNLNFHFISLIVVRILMGSALQAAEISTAVPGADGRLYFQTQARIDWEASAPPTVKALQLNREAPPELLARQTRYGFAEYRFEVKLDPAIAGAPYYLASPAGIAPLQDIRARGSARVYLAPSGRVTRKQYLGQLSGVVPKEHAQGGFLLAPPVRLSGELPRPDFSAWVSATSEGSQIHYVHRNEEGSFSLTKPQRHPREVVSSYHFRFGQSSYLFVQWEADAACNFGCCAFNSSLFEVGSHFNELAWNRYGCDI